MGDVVQMFKGGTVPNPGTPSTDEPFDVHEVLTEEFENSVTDVQERLDQLWRALSVDDFRAQVQHIKEEVAGWPDA